MQPVRALQSTGKSKACFTWHYAFVKNSLNKWNEKKEDIAHIMDITIIGNIQYSKKNLIQFKSVIGRTPKESVDLYDDI